MGLSAQAVVFFALIYPPVIARGEDQSFTSLFNGKDLAGWNTWLGAKEVPALPLKLWGDWPPQVGLDSDPSAVFSVIEEDSAPAIRISGEIWGALISQSEFADYHLQLQYKWGDARYARRADKPRNSGLLYHSTGEYGAFWSYWMRSVEFEIMEGRTGDFTSVDNVGGKIATRWDWDASYPWQQYDETGSKTAVGGMVFRVAAASYPEFSGEQWNTLDLYVLDDRAVHRVNGQTVLRIEGLLDQSSDENITLAGGRLQLQSEGAEVYFRNIRIRSITSLP
ncbi:MAG: hypothetical protein ACI9JM_001615 [Halioglobus sp.]|jgi:hypothetical protein